MANLVGQKFNRLKVLKDTGKRTYNGTIIWLCKCDCGNLKEVIGPDLKRNRVKSCGCLRKELSTNNRIGQKFGRLTVI